MKNHEGAAAPVIYDMLFSRKRFQKALHKKHAKTCGHCVVEGWKCFAEAVEVLTPIEVVVQEGLANEFTQRFPEVKAPVYEINVSEIKKLSQTVTPEGVLGLFPRPELNTSIDGAGLHLVLFEWRDPSNVGSVIRSARGLGLRSVRIWGSGPDFFSSKVIRSSMGSVFHVEIGMLGTNWSPTADEMVYFADAKGDDVHEVQIDPQKSNLLVIGSESHGLPQGIDFPASSKISLPLQNGLESLSAPVAAAILSERLLAG